MKFISSQEFGEAFLTNSSKSQMEVQSRSNNQLDTNHHVSIQNIEEENLVFSIKKKMETISISHCISRVSDEHSRGNEENYFPILVSIGPFHHGKDDFKAMEDQKWRYLNTLLNRKPNVEETLHICLKTLRRLEEKARKCYGESIEMESNHFIQMMLVDACFIIELFLVFAMKGLRRRDDPCFSSHERFLILRSDMILLENQIPFFILQELFKLVPIPEQSNQSLTELALRFFRKLIPGNREIPQDRIIQNIHHFLDLIRQYFLPTNPELPLTKWDQKLQRATELQAAGINISKATAETVMNIKFEDGVLKIPPLRIHDFTETLLRNLIALENHCCQYNKHITSYAFFMKCLVKSKEDVKLLRNKRILIVGLKKHEEILDLFKNLNADVNLKDFYYRGLCEQIDSHRNIKSQVVSLCCC